MVASANVHCQHCYLYHPSCLRMEGESPALQFTSSWKDILSLCTSAFKGNPGTKRACSFKRGSSIEIKKWLAKKKDYFIETLLNHCLKTCPVQLKKKNHCILTLGAIKWVQFQVTPRHEHFHLPGMDVILTPLLHEVVPSEGHSR